MKNSISIAFTGDIGFDKYMTKQWEDKNLLDSKILDFFHTADHVVANVEGAMIALSDFHGTSDKGLFFHAMDPASDVFFNAIEADVWNICNNHSMDAGLEGLESTLSYAKKNGAKTVGAGKNAEEAAKPVYFEEAGGVGMFSIGYQKGCVPAAEDKPGNFSWNDFDRIQKTVNEVKSKCKWCVLCIHGGEEFCNMPLPYIRNRYIKYLDMGVDIIVAHHPHVAQNYESFANGKKIFYSLGNFIFDTDYQRAQCNTDKGVLLKLIFTEEGWSYEALGLQLERGKEEMHAAEVPAIFTEINAEEYEKLIPLSAKARLKGEKKRQKYLYPAKTLPTFEDEGWPEFFKNYITESYAKNEYMDFAAIMEWAAEAEKGAYKESIKSVAEYIEAQL